MLGVVGDVVQDVVAWLAEPLQPATDTRASIFMQRGGSAANVAAFAGPRYPTRFIGCVGDDLGAVVVRAELESHDVDVRVQVRDHTGLIIVLVDQHGERTMVPDRGACQWLESVDPAWLDGVEVLHVTSYSLIGGSTPTAARALLNAQKQRGGQISLDTSSVAVLSQIGADNWLKMVAELGIDYVSGNVDECRMLGLADDGQPGPNLAKLPATTLLARRGSAPTVVLRAGCQPLSIPVAPVVDIKDLTGAGDAFNAGFLTATLQGAQLGDACLAGHQLAARVLRHHGASEGPTSQG